MQRGNKSTFRMGLILLPLGLSLIAMAVLLFSPLGVQPAKADNLYARIQGTVTDPTGAVLVGVKLAATNTGTNIVFTTESKADGSYVFLNLPIGTYNVAATTSGFRRFAAERITLTLDQVYVLNIKMELGQVSEQITVEATNVQVQTANTELGVVVNGDTIEDMPLIGRNWTQLQLMEPGVMASSDRFGTYSTNGAQSQQNSFLINGQDSNDLPLNTPLIIPSPDAIAEFNMVTNTINPEYGRNSGAIMNATIKSGTNSFHGDGFEFYRDTFLNAADFFTNQAQVFHQNQFGGTLGGPVIKNHTFFFFSYQGSRFRQPQATTTQTVYSSAELGGNFSEGADLGFNGTPGPVPVDGACPPANPTCAPTNPLVSPFPMYGDANSTCPVSGGVMCAAGTYYGKAYDNNGNLLISGPGGGTNGLFSTGVIPTQDFNSIATKLAQQFVPAPTNLTNNAYNFNAVSPGSNNQYLWQIDQTFNAKDSMRFYGFFQTNPTQDTLPFIGATLPGFPEQAQRHQKQFVASWTHVFNPSVLNEFRVGYTRFNFVAVEPVTVVQPSTYGFSITPNIPSGAQLPVIGVAGTQPGQVNFNIGFSQDGPQPRIDQTYQIDDNFSWVRGSHTMKFGYDGRKFEVFNPFGYENNGDFSFDAGGKFTTGNAGADFLLGIPDSYLQTSGNIMNDSAFGHYLYAQDSWKATQNLTINYGVGWQINTPLTDHGPLNNNRAVDCFIPNEQSTVYPTAPANLVFPGDPGCTPSGYNTGYGHFGPRLGIAWAPNAGSSAALGHLMGNPGQFSIRAAVGIYYDQIEEELSLQNLLAPPFGLEDFGVGDVGLVAGFAAPFSSVNPAAVNYTIYNGILAPTTGCGPNGNLTCQTSPVSILAGSISNKYPYTAPAPGSAVNFPFYEPMDFNVIDPRFSVPYSMNYNLTIQRELPGQMILSVGYVGAQGRHLERAYDLNEALPGLCAAIPACISTTGDRLLQGYYYPQNFPYNSLVFGGVGWQATDGDSNYNSLQVSLNKRLSHGLTFLLAYTYAHSIDDGSSYESSSGQQNGTRGVNPFPYYNRLNWGDSQFDARQRFVGSYSYELPVAHALSSGAFLSRVFKGWQISGSTTLQTGFPVTLYDTSFTSGTCWAYTYYGCADNPNQVAPVVTSDPRSTPDHYYFNTSAFAKATLGTFGNTGRGTLHGPGINSTNLALLKNIAVTESTRFQLRLESQNTFNHVNFNLPNSNINSSQFGEVTGDTLGPRLVQLGLKFYF